MLPRSLKITLILTLFVSNSYALENLGTYGKTYSIAEEDLLEKIQREAVLPRFSPQEIKELLRRKSYVNFHIPNALRDRVRKRRVIYTVPEDLVVDGRVIARKGEKINVLERLHIPVTYIVLKDYQLPAFVKYAERDTVTFLIVEGNVYELQRKYPEFRIYAGFPRILKVLGVERVPSIVYQSGDKLVVVEKAWTEREDVQGSDSAVNSR